MKKGTGTVNKDHASCDAHLTLTRAVNNLRVVIQCLPGETKKLTLLVKGESVSEIIVNRDGSLGRNPNIEMLICAKLARGIREEGVMLIRAFDGPSTPVVSVHDVRSVNQPQIKLFCVIMGGGEWRYLSADEVRDLYTSCPCCGEKKPDEPNMTYGDLGDVVGGCLRK